MNFNLINFAHYNAKLNEATKRNDKRALAILTKIGEPINGVYNNEHFKSLIKQRGILHKYGGATYSNSKPYWQELLFHDVPIMLSEYSIFQMIKYVKGINYCANSPFAEENPNFIIPARQLDIPIYLTLGHKAYNCSYQLGERWFNILEAPTK